METYGFDSLSIRCLKSDLSPDTTKKIHVLDGTPKEGGPTAMEITGLAKEPVKVYAGNGVYFLARKGTGPVAVNFGLLDVPPAVEAEILGMSQLIDGIDGFGEDTEPPYVGVVAEAQDLYGEPVAFAICAGTFNKDGISLATATDEEFTPEAGEYVHNAMDRKITSGEVTKSFKVLRAIGKENVTALKKAVLGEATVTP